MGVELGADWLKTQNPRGLCFDFEPFETENSVANVAGLIRLGASKGIRIFIGLGISDQALGAQKALEETSSLLISPTATSTEILTAGTNRSILVYPTNQVIAYALAREARKRGLQKIVSAFNPQSRYGQDMNAHFVAEFQKLGGTIVSIEVPPGARNSQEVLDALKKLGAGVVFVPMFEVEAARLISRIVKANVNIEFIGTDAWGTDSQIIRRLVRNSQSRAFVPEIYSPSKTLVSNRFLVSRYKNFSQKNPTDLVAYSFDSLLIANALLKSCRVGFLDSPSGIEPCLQKIFPLEVSMGVLKGHKSLGILREVGIKNVVLDLVGNKKEN